jgi:aryl-alcohol dehydrogenase-like predicted oxidoreductase
MNIESANGRQWKSASGLHKVHRMEKRQLGNSDLYVSPMIFGAWAIGGWMWGGTDDAAAIDAIRASIDHGINTIDTAAVYGFGHSEDLVRQAIKGRREKVILATKCGLRWDTEEGSEPWPQPGNDGKPLIIRKNSRPASIAWECEQSLKRLGVDVIDLYQIHRPDMSTPIEESTAALEKLRREGKVRAIGVSNYALPILTRAAATAPLATNQPAYSVIQRGIEKEIIPFCRQKKISIICYSPLERGLLTGAVGPERKFNPTDHRNQHKFFTPENRKRVADALAAIKPIADAHGATFGQTIIAWTIRQPGITAALVGARNVQQAVDNAQALNVSLSADELGKIRAAFDECASVMSR